MAVPEPGSLAEPQSVLVPLTAATIFLVLTIDPGGEQAVRDLLGDVAALRRSVGFRVSGAELTCVAGVSSGAWDRLFGGPRPAELHPFRDFTGAKHHTVSTPGDLLFHIRADRMDLCFEYATQVMARLDGSVTVQDEVHGFRYFEERDLIGFVDGTENPEGKAAAAAAIVGAADGAIVGEAGNDSTAGGAGQDSTAAGGSYVIVQKYLHDMDAWNALPVEEQERVIGRTKLSDIELPDDVKPTNSHVALNTITGPDGAEQQIVRANMPFGTLGKGEFGTYFIGYSASPAVTEQMLENMFIGRPPGHYDRILDFSTPVTGCLFFAPSADFLDDLPDGPAPDVAAAAPVPDGSLRIGSLKRSDAP
jgi:putative iron-dependent peroxidase